MALVFASDGQLDLLRPALLIYVNAMFRVVYRRFTVRCLLFMTLFVQFADSFPEAYALIKITASYD